MTAGVWKDPAVTLEEKWWVREQSKQTIYNTSEVGQERLVCDSQNTEDQTTHIQQEINSEKFINLLNETPTH